MCVISADEPRREPHLAGYRALRISPLAVDTSAVTVSRTVLHLTWRDLFTRIAFAVLAIALTVALGLQIGLIGWVIGPVLAIALELAIYSRPWLRAVLRRGRAVP
jgi:hypothetical protein